MSEQATERKEMLKRLFFEALGVFTRTNEEKSYFTGRSMATDKPKYDEWVEPHYFLGKVEVTREEYAWLNTFLGEIEVPVGYVRIANDTNDLLRIPPMPGRNDVLVITKKPGRSQRDEWFRGHPSECKISLTDRRTVRQIERITLNGRLQESEWVNLSRWSDPRLLAVWALQEAGMADPASKYIEALAEVYRRQLGK